ncbi:MAG: hypothetical protein ACFFBE_02370 [Promethearchaeota archaeon]
MEFLAVALEDYYSNALKSKFIFFRHCLQKEYNGLRLNFDLGIYFRSLSDLDPLERKLIDLSYGKILDVGSNTGYYIPYLMKKGPTIGIEISPRINSIARKEGLMNCVIGDIFKYNFYKLFDTITLIGNDIALSGTLLRLRKLLKKLKKLLNEDGQVLLIISHIRTLKYWHAIYTPWYDKKLGIPFKILFLNVFYFIKLSMKNGFRATIHGKYKSKGNMFYLVRLVKSS